MQYETLLVDLSGHVAMVRMNRPETMNALEYQLLIDLIDCFQKFSDDDEVRVVVLTGTGNAFSAGGDLRGIRHGMTVDRARRLALQYNKIILSIRNLEKLVIASINGAAVGAGFSMAMACDLVVASEDAKFSLAFVKLGLIPDMGATYFAPRFFGLQKAKELAFTGKTLYPHELAELGMINFVVSPRDLENKVLELARELASGPPIALRLTKKVLNQSWNFSLEDLLEIEAQTQAGCMQSEDHREGLSAFFEKRKGQFKGK